MTTANTTADYRSVLAACRHRPEEDVPRLMLADELTSMGAEEMECPQCHGSGTRSVSVTNAALSRANGYSPLTQYSEWRGCRVCSKSDNEKGTGVVRDLTRERHAELIRCQIRDEQITCELQSPTDCGGDCCAERRDVRNRIAELTAALADYRPSCPVCRQSNGTTKDEYSRGGCDCCKDKHRIGTWERGLLTLTVPTIEAVWENMQFPCMTCAKNRHNKHYKQSECKICGGKGNIFTSKPTPWALTAVNEFPVVQIVVEDRVPSIRDGVYSWASERCLRHATEMNHECRIPAVVFDRLPGDMRGVQFWSHYHSREQAIDALATAFVLAVAAHTKEEK